MFAVNHVDTRKDVLEEKFCGLKKEKNKHRSYLAIIIRNTIKNCGGSITLQGCFLLPVEPLAFQKKVNGIMKK